MKQFRVIALDVRHDFRPVMLEDRYRLDPSKGWVWLQRACIAILRRLGCNAYGDEVVTRVQEIYPKRVVEALFKQREVAERLGSGEAREVYMGPEEYRDLMRDEWIAGKVTFRAELRKGGYELMGLNITVVPWMRGILVV